MTAEQWLREFPGRTDLCGRGVLVTLVERILLDGRLQGYTEAAEIVEACIGNLPGQLKNNVDQRELVELIFAARDWLKEGK